MATAHKRSGEFRKVGRNLFRYSTNKTYYAVFKIGGKKIWRSLETADRALADRKLAVELRKRGLVDPRQSRTTLAQLLELYEQGLEAHAPHTQSTRRSILSQFKSSWTHGLDIPVNTITTGQVELWLAGHRARLRNASWNEYLRFVRQVFNLAVSHKVIAESPAANLKQLRIEQPIRVTPTWEQFKSIVDDVRAQRLSPDAQDTADLVQFMGEAGVGTAECANMRGEHLDFERQRIVLYRSKTDRGYEIPMYPQVLPLLQKIRDNGLVRNGQPVFRVRDPKRALAAACRRLNLPHLSTRSLRRCFITRAVEKGVDFKTIASWQGHQDGGVLIAKTYSHLRSEHSDRMALKLA